MYSYEDELKHYGTLGQKWGARRYQNPDGTLTDAGKARYGTEKGSNRSARKFAKALNRTDKHISIYKSEQARAEGRMIKAQRKGNQKKYDKNKQYHDELSSRIQGLENTQQQTYHDAKEGAGMDVSSRARTRDVQAGRQFTRWFFLGLLPAAIGSGIDYHKYGKEGAGLVEGQRWDVYMPLDDKS